MNQPNSPLSEAQQEVNPVEVEQENIPVIPVPKSQLEIATEQPNGEFVYWGHYYSCLPDQQERDKFPAEFEKIKWRKSLPGIEFPEKNFHAHLDSMARHFPGCPFKDTAQPGLRYYFDNPFYSYADAISLYTLILEQKPKKIIEVGSGFSSAVMLDTNERMMSGSIELTFIEPDPHRLLALLKEEDKTKTRIIADYVQNVDPSIFLELQAGDILFIDSTHASKLGSDVNFLYFEILPLLNKGVNIHIHDIFWPFEYLPAWVTEGRCWNEAYLLRALLIHTKRYEVIYASDYSALNYYEWIQKNLEIILNNTGGHIWLRVV